MWLSPSGKTAYGVIYVHLPFPVGPDLALRGFMREMRRREGEAALLDRRADPQLPGLRFVAQGRHYTLRASLQITGWNGWVVYAGTLRQEPVACDELALAEQGREQTRMGVRSVGSTTQPPHLDIRSVSSAAQHTQAGLHPVVSAEQ